MAQYRFAKRGRQRRTAQVGQEEIILGAEQQAFPRHFLMRRIHEQDNRNLRKRVVNLAEIFQAGTHVRAEI